MVHLSAWTHFRSENHQTHRILIWCSMWNDTNKSICIRLAAFNGIPSIQVDILLTDFIKTWYVDNQFKKLRLSFSKRFIFHERYGQSFEAVGHQHSTSCRRVSSRAQNLLASHLNSLARARSKSDGVGARQWRHSTSWYQFGLADAHYQSAHTRTLWLCAMVLK